ncbi:MAG: polynucleotide adenylyltransferase PcnB [Gammaproteobacteria bacterium]|nr:polynucleotide adenylyltransferase PcnB [Gammaproteobacteria bacterium]
MHLQETSKLTPKIIARADHNISRSQISENALKVLYRLKNAGYAAYLVGGGVRDLLLGREPKDFDVATDARPEQIHALFRNCRIIGRRFRLAHVQFGREIIEVATFRAAHSAPVEQDPGHDNHGRILIDNTYGTLEQDAFRRDFTVNALYYDIRDFSVADYVGGVEDLGTGTLRLIGEPYTRYREDPVRMLRAVRFAAKLGFRMHADTSAPITALAPLLDDIPAARMFEEILKLFLYGFGLQAFESLRHFGLFGRLFPRTDAILNTEEQGFPHTFIAEALAGTDARVNAGKPVTPAFLFAALLWQPVRQRAMELETQGLHSGDAVRQAVDEVLPGQIKQVALPRRFSTPMIEIYQLQPRFTQREGKRPQRLMAHPRFRAAYDFLVLRAAAGELDPELAHWWTEIQTGDAAGLASPPAPHAGRRRRRKRRGRRATAPPT